MGGGNLIPMIQEAKHAISKIEDIFSTHLYPDFHSESKSLHENDLLLHIGKLEEELKEKTNALYESKQAQNDVEEINAILVKKLKLQCESEGKLREQLKCLEEKVEELEMNLREKSKESFEVIELHGKLLQLIEAKDSRLVTEMKKRRDLKRAYKRLKSQIHYLSKKIPQTSYTSTTLVGTTVKPCSLATTKCPTKKEDMNFDAKLKKGIKHVEPVRKKGKKKNLKGIKCKQYKRLHNGASRYKYSTFQKKAPNKTKEINKFAEKAMKNKDFRVFGIRCEPRGVKVQIARKRNGDENATKELYK